MSKYQGQWWAINRTRIIADRVLLQTKTRTKKKTKKKGNPLVCQVLNSSKIILLK